MNPLETLTQLESAQLVRRADGSEMSYLFKHTLTQESVYESLLRTKRTELHRRVAEAIESVCGPDIEPNAAILAMHYERAGVDDRAFTYAVLAGDIAARSYAHREAVMLYDRALSIAGRSADPSWYPNIRQAYSSRGRVLEVNGNNAAAVDNYRDMIAFAQRVGDMAMEADGLTRMLTTQGTLGDVPDADRQLMRALDLARQSGDQALVGRALWNLGLAVRFRTPLRATDYFIQALEHARVTGLRELEGYVLADLAAEMMMTGQWNRSLEFSNETLTVFRELDNKPMIANALGTLGEVYYGRGEAELARQAAQDGANISKAIENPWGIGYNEWTLLALESDAGEFDTAIKRSDYILAVSGELGIPLFPGMANTVLARLYAEVNQLERAHELIQLAFQQLSFMNSTVWSGLGAGMSAHIKNIMGQLDAARDLLFPFSEPPAWQTENLWVMSFAGMALTELALAEGDMSRAKQIADTLIPRLEEQGMFRFVVELQYMRARAECALGDLGLAKQDLAQARESAGVGRNNHLLWRIHAELSSIARVEGDPARAVDEMRQARELVFRIASHISDPDVHASFLARPDVSQVINTI